MRKPLKQKIEEAEAALSDAQDRVDELYDKQRRSTLKSSRKQHRKKMVFDPIYRATHGMLFSMQREMFEGIMPEPGAAMKSLLETVEASDDE